MNEFFNALTNPSIPFFRYAFLAGIMAGVAFGIMGSYVVARRITYIAGAISHCVLGGIGAALFLQKKAGLAWCNPMYGAIIAALLAAIIIGLVSMKAKQREDTVIGALWAVGMAVGIIFIAKTPGYVDPMSYLFGDILLVSKNDLWIVAALDALVVVLSLIFYNKFLAVCFDENFAKLRGIKVEFYYLLLLCLTALTIVLLVSVVGIVMVIAMLTLPAAVAGHFTRRLWQMMGLAMLLSMTFTSVGLACSYTMNLPSGPTIIVFAGTCYILAALFKRFKGKGVS
jgi:zinc transport system permease protein